MVNIKRTLLLIYQQIRDYNRFIPDENDYDDEIQDPVIALQHQKYATRLYIVLLVLCFYMLFYATLTQPQVRTVIISNIDFNKFEELYLTYGELISCPCSTIATSYKTFISNTIQFHSVCSSVFVTQHWIDGLYLLNRSSYGVGDFRTTATSQFQLLSSLCSYSRNMISEKEIELNNKQLITDNVQSSSKIQSEINAVIESFKQSLSTRMSTFITYFRVVTQANNFVTGLNTNVLAMVYSSEEYMAIVLQFLVYRKDKIRMSCGWTPSISPTAIYPNEDSVWTEPYSDGYTEWIDPNINSSTIINGFYTGCTPFEALLQSTLDCLYEIECLQILNDYFPSVNHMNLNLTNSILSTNKTNMTVREHLSNLFIVEWATKMNYSAYFHSCNPLVCTYLTTSIVNYSYAITLFISLYGGLIMILRMISLFLIKFISKLNYERINQVSIQIFLAYLQKLNLFKIADRRTDDDVKRQKLITRVYIILLMITIAVLLLFNSLNIQTITITTSNPSLTTYMNLQEKHSQTLRCPCSTVTIAYHRFLSFSPVLHVICSSEWITDKWLTILKQSTLPLDNDWRNRAYQHFTLLSKLCQVVNETVTDTIKQFLLQSFIVSTMPIEIDFHAQINKILSQFYQSTIIYIQQLIHAIDIYIKVDQPYMVKFTDETIYPDAFTIEIVEKNANDSQQYAKITIPSIEIKNISSNLIVCACSSTPNCQTSSAIFTINYTKLEGVISYDYNFPYVIPGSFVACSEINSLFVSTFECFYSDSDCLLILMNLIKAAYIWNTENPFWYDVKPLVYNSTSNNFDRNSSVLTIVQNLMIEQWNPSYSYETFYELCSPNHCFHEERIYSNNLFNIFIILLSMIGGLTISLRLITPYLIVFIMKLFSIITRKQEQQQIDNEIVHLNWFDRLKLMKRNTIRFFYDVCININVFPSRKFGNNIDRRTATNLGKQTTRIYIILLIISFTLLGIYTLTQKQILMETFNKPSFHTYKQLEEKYGDQLTCSCTSIEIIYGEIINIKSIFHPICSSQYISNEFIDHLVSNVSPKISIYQTRDYRRLILSHIFYLKELCRISIESVENSIEHFLSTSFVTKDLLIENNFNNHISLAIEQTKQNARSVLNSIFFLIRNVTFGNAIMSTYGTNFRYSYDLPDWEGLAFVDVEIYDNDCSCALNSNCTSPAYFLESNDSSNKIELQGLKIGCTPSESFLLSTLECFYNETCIHIIKQYINYSQILDPISITTIENRTIEQLVKNLFIDQWLITKNYSLYYQQCLPLSCSYSYVQDSSLIYIFSFILSLQGGLILVLKWICPQLVLFVVKIKKYRNKHSNIISPDDDNRNVEVENPVNTRPHLLKIIKMCIISMCLIVILVIYSIYTVKREDNLISQTISSTSTTTITTTTTTSLHTSTMKKAICRMKFERKSVFINDSDVLLVSNFIGDFNNDNQLDISLSLKFFTMEENIPWRNDEFLILYGNGNGTFQSPIRFPVTGLKYFADWLISDFNRDHWLDIAVINDTNFLYVYFGNENGTFEKGAEVYVEHDGSDIEMCSADLNNDSYLDFVMTSSNYAGFIIYFGSINGTFIEELTHFTSAYIVSSQVIAADFNNDDIMDIAMIYLLNRGIVIYNGYGNGSFDAGRLFFTGGGMNPKYFAVGDFNEDKILDIVVVYSGQSISSVFFGYGNATFGERVRLIISIGVTYAKPVVDDFNQDGHLDIAIVTRIPSTIHIFYGDGNGSFEVNVIDVFDFSPDMSRISVADFNSDGYPDIFAIFDLNIIIFFNTGQCDNELETSTSIY